MILKFVFMLLICLPVFVFGNIAAVFTFNDNLMLETDTFAVFSERVTLPMAFFSNSYIVLIFDVYGNSEYFFGPSSHDYNSNIFSFSFNSSDNRENRYSFSEYFNREGKPEADKNGLKEISLSCGFDDLYLLLSAHDSLTADSPVETLNASGRNSVLLLNDFIRIKNAELKEKYETAKSCISKLSKKYPDDKDVMKLKLYNCMDLADFYGANLLIDNFYKQIEKDETYYSLKGNLFALWGKFDLSVKYIESGRNIFPESEMLLNDAINIYSVTDSLKMDEFLIYWKNKKLE